MKHENLENDPALLEKGGISAPDASCNDDPDGEIRVSGPMWVAGMVAHAGFSDDEFVIRFAAIYEAMERVRRQELDPEVKRKNAIEMGFSPIVFPAKK